MVVGVPNVGKSALINSIHRIATSRFPGIIISEKNKLLFWIIWDPCLYCCTPVHDKNKRATVGPLPGVTQDIAGYKVRIWTKVYVLEDTYQSKYCKKKEWGTLPWNLIRGNVVHSLAKMEMALHFCYCMEHLICGICSLLSICETLGYVTCPLIHLVCIAFAIIVVLLVTISIIFWCLMNRLYYFITLPTSKSVLCSLSSVHFLPPFLLWSCAAIFIPCNHSSLATGVTYIFGWTWCYTCSVNDLYEWNIFTCSIYIKYDLKILIIFILQYFGISCILVHLQLHFFLGVQKTGYLG